MLSQKTDEQNAIIKDKIDKKRIKALRLMKQIAQLQDKCNHVWEDVNEPSPFHMAWRERPQKCTNCGLYKKGEQWNGGYTIPYKDTNFVENSLNEQPLFPQYPRPPLFIDD